MPKSNLLNNKTIIAVNVMAYDGDHVTDILQTVTSFIGKNCSHGDHIFII